MSMRMNPTFGSLFAGIGGFDMGMEQAGWECKFQVEWDKHCTSVLEYHWADVPKWGDVSQVNGAEIPPVDCIIFGSPCQDLSTAGKKKGLVGNKSSLFFQATRIIKEMKDATNGSFPKWSIWENVAGAMSSNKGADFGKVLDSLADTGAMVIEWKLLDSIYFNIPQRRRRIFVVAGYHPACGGSDFPQIFPFNKGSQWADIKTEEESVMFYRCHGVFDPFTIGYSPTLKAGQPVCVVSETRRPRLLTPLEHERLQGYPDDHTRWRSDGSEQSDTQRYKQCGNGVSAPVAKWIGEQVMAAHQTLLHP